jgi:hypothetical protein
MIRKSVFAVVAALAAAVPSAQAAPMTSPSLRTQAAEVVVGPPEVVDGSSAVEGWALGMVVDQFGTATMLWDRGENGRYAAQRSPAGVWSAPQLIGCAHVYFCGAPQLGVDDTGTVTAVWDVLAGRPEVVVATLAPGAPWSAPVTLTRGPGREHGYEPRLAVAPNGAAAVSWLSASGSSSFIARKRAGRSWTSVAVKHLAQMTTGVAIAPGGTVLAVGTDSDEARRPRALVKIFRPSRGWQPTHVLGKAGGDTPAPLVAIGPRHRAAVAWTIGPWPALSPSAVIVRRMNRHFRWAAPERISRRLGDNATPVVLDLAMDSQRRVTVLWHGHATKATTRLADGRWASRRVVPKSGMFAFGGLTGNQAGALAVPWIVGQYNDVTGERREEVHVSLRAAGAIDWLTSPSLDVTFGGTGERGDPGSRPFSVGVLPDGSTVVCWFDLTNALVARIVR